MDACSIISGTIILVAMLSLASMAHNFNVANYVVP